jgi:hypothetical protein
LKILGAAIGNCVHVAGIQSFLEIARSLGYETQFLGPAVPVPKLVAAIKEKNPDIVAISYRLTPVSFAGVLDDLRREVSRDPSLRSRKYVFGGTPPVVKLARESNLFEALFEGGESREETVSVITRTSSSRVAPRPPEKLVLRVDALKPMPLLRHHFGLPSLEDTIDGARKIAESGLVDILSIAPDQNAQESLFRPAEMDPRLDGAGGVPLRSEEDLRKIFAATRVGNFPLLRCYSGTRDLIKWGQMLKQTIDVAWGAVPLTWYSELDARSKRTLEEAISENQAAIKWYAENGIPVEVNESHQWALRRCGDTIELATAYLSAYNARALGVRDYVCQFMFDTPAGVSPAMDLAKMLAKVELVESLANEGFRVIRMVRSGLSSLSPYPNVAKGQLASSVYSAMAVSPHIVHVVGFSEADHASTAEEVVESCAIAKGAISKALLGLPSSACDPALVARKSQLIDESRLLVDSIKRLRVTGSGDPLLSPKVLSEAVREGFLDATDLRGGAAGRGRICTAIVNGACVAVDEKTGRVLSERERIKMLAVSDKDLDLAEI